MQNYFLEGFGDELMKVAARKGLKIIRALVAEGSPKSMAKANRLAKTRRVLPDVKRTRVRDLDGNLIGVKRSPGHQIKHLGSGQEQASTIVADPKHGIVVRKLVHKKSQATPAQIAARKKVMQEAGGRGSTKHKGSYVTGDAGRSMEFHELGKGETSHRVLSRMRDGSAEKAQAARAIEEAQKKVRAAGKRSGQSIGDMGSHRTGTDNILLDKGRDGKWKARVVDFNAARDAKNLRKVAPGGGIRQPTSPSVTAKDTFRPSTADQAAWEKKKLGKAPQRAKQKSMRGEGDAMSRSIDKDKTTRNVKPKSERELAIEAAMKAGKGTRVKAGKRGKKKPKPKPPKLSI